MTMQFDSCRVTVFPGAGPWTVYMPMQPDEAEKLLPYLTDSPTLVALHELDWNGVLTPWPAPRAFRGGADFTGGAEAFLHELTACIVPAVEEETGLRKRLLAGYSLGGLFAVYGAVQSGAFDASASMSGSMWYDGFIPWLEEHADRAPERMYFSLGDREHKTRNARMAPVEDCTVQAVEILRRAGRQVTWEKRPGGHFDGVGERITRGINIMTV